MQKLELVNIVCSWGPVDYHSHCTPHLVAVLITVCAHGHETLTRSACTWHSASNFETHAHSSDVLNLGGSRCTHALHQFGLFSAVTVDSRFSWMLGNSNMESWRQHCFNFWCLILKKKESGYLFGVMVLFIQNWWSSLKMRVIEPCYRGVSLIFS